MGIRHVINAVRPRKHAARSLERRLVRGNRRETRTSTAVDGEKNPEDPGDADEDESNNGEPEGGLGHLDDKVEDEEAAAANDADEEEEGDEPDVDVAGPSI